MVTQPVRNFHRAVLVPFDVTIDGVNHGRKRLKLSHSANRVAAQNNAPTFLHTGDLQSVLSNATPGHAGHWIALEAMSDGTYRLTITRQSPGEFIE